MLSDEAILTLVSLVITLMAYALDKILDRFGTRNTPDRRQPELERRVSGTVYVFNYGPSDQVPPAVAADLCFRVSDVVDNPDAGEG
ncbi:hypothetical protein TWF718_003137 [Orbilia javanica]|uniref:Uncharacterized protein n=1 Tax=Orbilia javanica TaxID=47235 RepID=A0AAN8MFP8_9PEZI